MSEEISHAWITEVLKDIAVFAESQNQPKVAALISAARSAVIQVLGTDDTNDKNSGAKEEQWFGIVLDELARYCHIHGLTETEKHLLYRFYSKTRNFSWVMMRKLSDTLSRNFCYSCGMVSRMNARMALANCF